MLQPFQISMYIKDIGLLSAASHNILCQPKGLIKSYINSTQ